MWSNARPSSRSSVGDHFNNNNPYSRSAAVSKNRQVQRNTTSDPWDWGWEDNSSQQDDWGTGWSQPTQAGVIQTQVSHPLPPKSEKKAHGTPDLIPEKSTPNIYSGNQQRFNNVMSNSSDYFENVDLVSNSHQQNSAPQMYNPTEMSRPQHQNSDPVFSYYQPVNTQQSTVHNNPQSVSYYRQSNSPNTNNSEQTHYYQQQQFGSNSYQNYQPEPQVQMYQQQMYFDQNLLYSSNSIPVNTPNVINNTTEVENIEVAPPEKAQSPPHPVASSTPAAVQEISPPKEGLSADEPTVPDNQETISDNEEHPGALESQMSQLRLNSDPADTWNNVPGWENQEVAPRCELDRNQYLETGQLHESSDAQDTNSRIDLENNDEAEAFPPPGLHRMVTGQVTESLSQRSVLGQPPGDSGTDIGLQRLIPGEQTHNSSPVSSDSPNLHRLIPGQTNHDAAPPQLDSSSFQRMVPGQFMQPDTQSMQRLIPGQTEQNIPNDHLGFHRLVPGQTESGLPLETRMIPGQLSDDEPVTSDSRSLERMVPGGTSEQEVSIPGDDPEYERMVPGGVSDVDSRSQSVSNDGESRHSSERMIPGRTMQNETDSRVTKDSVSPQNVDRRVPPDPERCAPPGLSKSPEIPVMSAEGIRHVVGQRTSDLDTNTQPPPGLHRMVLGQINSQDSGDMDLNRGQTPDRLDDSALLNGSIPPPGLHRMVLGEFREKQGSADREKDKENGPGSEKEKDRNEDSDSDYRSERRKHRHRKDSFDEDRRERDYSSERDYRAGRRDDRDRDRYRKRHDNSYDRGYNRSPDYRSDHEDYERHDYREHRDRDRRDRPRERDRRRRSPDYSYDSYYRDEPRPNRERMERERDWNRDRRYYDQYRDHYDDDHYYRENRSRPSSRTGSDYRRQQPRDYPPRYPYYPDQVSSYQHMHYYQMYYENLRRNDPQAYAIWYERYMAEKLAAAAAAAGGNNFGIDRASVHSGRSSANEHTRRHEREQDEEDVDAYKTEDISSQRSTPKLFPSAHIRGGFSNLGQLVVVNPEDTYDYGTSKTHSIYLCKMPVTSLADTSDIIDFLRFPGPFVVGTTHKNTVHQYLKHYSDKAVHSAEKLLYELIRLVIRLNGVVDMTDVAGLLMDSYRLRSDSNENYHQEQNIDSSEPQLTPQQVTNKFRELLLEGNKSEALEWAMKNRDWGHALFLASKMDSRTHNNVMLRFANGLHSNDPLQTLYQLMSGREPQAATCAADKKWGDWRPHLAMMISNQTSNVELNRKAIITLGDSLGARGRLFASHFCYLTAQLEFSNYSDRNRKLVLLGASPDKPFSQFATCKAIMLTLCYEFAKQLSDKDYFIPTLRVYKYLLAVRLVDHGQLTPALSYLETVAEDMMHTPTHHDRMLVQHVVDLADKIKFNDSSISINSDPTVDPDWLSRLKQYLSQTSDPNYLSSNLTHGVSTSTMSDAEFYNNGEQSLQPPVDVGYNQEVYYDNSQQRWTSPQVQGTQTIQDPLLHPGFSADAQQSVESVVDNNGSEYWNDNAVSWSNTQQQPQSTVVEEQTSVMSSTNIETSHNVPAPAQISVKSGFGYFDNSDNIITPQVEKPVSTSASTATSTTSATTQANKPSRRQSKENQSRSTGGSSWFGGIWDKLALRPKNQMKLPDDRNPSIVWDEKSKRWVNTDASDEDEAAQLKPPPRASELASFKTSVPASASDVANIPRSTSTPPSAPVTSTPAPPPPPLVNKYKLQRGKGMRGNYVDVMNPGNKKPSTTVPPPDIFPQMTQTPVTNFFVPAHVPGNENAPIDFVSPSGPVSYDLSTKTDDQSAGGGLGNQPVPPAFYNPANYASS